MDKLEIAIVTDVTIGKCYDHMDEKVRLVISSEFANSGVEYTIFDQEILDFIVKNKIENLTDMVGKPIIYKISGNAGKCTFEKFFDE